MFVHTCVCVCVRACAHVCECVCRCCIKGMTSGRSLEVLHHPILLVTAGCLMPCLTVPSAVSAFHKGLVVCHSRHTC